MARASSFCGGRVELLAGEADFLRERVYAVDAEKLEPIIHSITASGGSVRQIVQDPSYTKDAHGIVHEVQDPVPIQKHLLDVQAPRRDGRAVYNHNAQLHGLLPLHTIEAFFQCLPRARDDEAHRCLNIFSPGSQQEAAAGVVTGSADILIGGPNSGSRWHQDGPLRCTSREPPRRAHAREAGAGRELPPCSPRLHPGGWDWGRRSPPPPGAPPPPPPPPP
jgi:hypothetical protein